MGQMEDDTMKYLIMGLGIAYDTDKVGMIARDNLQDITDIIHDWVKKTGIKEPEFLDVRDDFDYDELKLGQLLLFKDGKSVVPIVNVRTVVTFGDLDL